MCKAEHSLEANWVIALVVIGVGYGELARLLERCRAAHKRPRCLKCTCCLDTQISLEQQVQSLTTPKFATMSLPPAEKLPLSVRGNSMSHKS